MQSVGFPGSLLAKTLIIHYEPSGRISVILVPETLGFCERHPQATRARTGLDSEPAMARCGTRRSSASGSAAERLASTDRAVMVVSRGWRQGVGRHLKMALPPGGDMPGQGLVVFHNV
jgi:hypothetical protein